MVTLLCSQISTSRELRLLGCLGLGVDNKTIDTHMENHKSDINEAAYRVLKVWSDSVKDRKEAYVQLREALTKDTVKMNKYVGDCLESTWKEESRKRQKTN